MPQTWFPPTSLDESSLELLIARLSRLPADPATINLDLGHVAFMDPYGMAGILELGRHLARQGHKLLLHLPLSMEVQRDLDRMSFFRHLSEFYTMYPPYRPLAARARSSGPSDVLLEITRISRPADIQAILRKINGRSREILQIHLHYGEDAIQDFQTTLSEICQNIIEHSENTGLVGIQKYSDETRRNKNVVKVAVMDLGVGFKGSLSSRLGSQYGARWSDLAALEEALLHGTSRYPEAGRGQGLAAVKKFVRQWDGQLTIRSGTARLSLFPEREHGKDRETSLPEFPGAQISLVLPER